MRNCDNKNAVHDMQILTETPQALTAYCKNCKEFATIKTGDKKKYKQYFKRDTLQPHENLYYKVYPHRMNII